MNEVHGLDRVARSFFGAKRQACLRIDVSGVVAIYGVKSDIDDAGSFHVSLQLYGVATEVHATRDDFNFHVRGAGKV